MLHARAARSRLGGRRRRELAAVVQTKDDHREHGRRDEHRHVAWHGVLIIRI